MVSWIQEHYAVNGGDRMKSQSWTDHDKEDRALATSPEFWQMIRQRRTQGDAIPLAEVEARLLPQRKFGRKPRKKT